MPDEGRGAHYQPPSPYVTHESLNPLWSEVGGLKRGQQAQEAAFGSLRAELLTRLDQSDHACARKLDKLESLIRDQHRYEPTEPPASGITLSIKNLFIAALALVGTGLFFGAGGSLPRLQAELSGGTTP